MSLVVLKKLLDSLLPCIAMAHIFKYEGNDFKMNIYCSSIVTAFILVQASLVEWTAILGNWAAHGTCVFWTSRALPTTRRLFISSLLGASLSL